MAAITDIQPLTWWRSADRRLFLVLERPIEPVPDEPGEWRIYKVVLLELLADQVTERPYDEIRGLVEKGLLVPVPEAVKEKYAKDKVLI